LLLNNLPQTIKIKKWKPPLHKAVWVGDKNLPLIKLLLANKANANAKDNRGNSVLDVYTGVEVKKNLEKEEG
jgi:hypothetical protein